MVWMFGDGRLVKVARAALTFWRFGLRSSLQGLMCVSFDFFRSWPALMRWLSLRWIEFIALTCTST